MQLRFTEDMHVNSPSFVRSLLQLDIEFERTQKNLPPGDWNLRHLMLNGHRHCEECVFNSPFIIREFAHIASSRRQESRPLQLGLVRCILNNHSSLLISVMVNGEGLERVCIVESDPHEDVLSRVAPRKMYRRE